MKNKKILAALLCAVAVFALASCGGNGNGGGTEEPPVVETEKFTVTFNANGGSNVASQEVETGKKVTKPSNPTKEGYTFGGWYKEAACTNAWNFDTDTVSANTTLYAKWTVNSYAVTFDAQGGSDVAGANVDHNGVVAEPTAPTKVGYTFGGWYKEAACENAWNFAADKVTGAVTLYAKWTINAYAVTFDAQGGSAVAAVNVEHGAKVTAPAAPTKAGYEFVGWYKEAACTTAWNFAEDTVTGAVTLYAKWSINAYAVTFDAQGGSAVAAVNVEHGAKVTAPAAPTKEGHTFAGWYTEATCENAWDFAEDAVTGATTLYAKWTLNVYAVTFNSQRGSEVAAVNVNHGAKVTTPAAPTRTGYVFGGWYKEAACENAWNFDTDTVTGATTLYAKWTLATYAVTFDSQEGSTVEGQTVNYGGNVTAPEAPTRVGYTFGGWYKEAECTTAWDFTKDAVTAEVTLYAKWTLNVYEVTFDTQDGNQASTADVNHGALATAPAEPTRTGYTFGGWYTEADCTNAWDFAEDVVTGETTLYAKWTKNVYEVTFMNETVEFDVQDVEYRDEAVAPATNPEQHAKVFVGWYADAECTTEFDFATKITEATTVYAKFRDMTTYERLSAYNNVMADDFSTYTAETKLDRYLSNAPEGEKYVWNAEKGLVEYFNDKSAGGTTATNYVKFDGAIAELVDTGNDGTQLIADFGQELFNGVVEIYFEFTPINGGTGWTPVQLVGDGNTEFFGIRIDKINSAGQYVQYRINGGSATCENQVAMSNGVAYACHFVIDLTNETVTATVNGTAIATNVAITSETIKGIKFTSGDGNTKTLSLDNLAVANEELALADYALLAKASVLETYNGLTATVTTNALELAAELAAANAAIDAATTNAEVRAAANAGIEALEAVLTDEEQAVVNAEAQFNAEVAAAKAEIEGYRAEEIDLLESPADDYYINEIAAVKADGIAFADSLVFDYENILEIQAQGAAKLAEVKAAVDQYLAWSALSLDEIKTQFVNELGAYVDEAVLEYDTDNHVTTTDKANLSEDIYAAENVGIAAINGAVDPNAAGAALEEAKAAVDALIEVLKARTFEVAYVNTTLAADTVVWGSTLELPANPTKENAYFVGWYTDIALTTPLTGEVVVKNNVRLFAKWYDAKHENNLVEKGFGLDEDGYSTITTTDFTTYDDGIISLHLTKGEAQKKQGSYYPLYMGGKTSSSHYIEIDLTEVPSTVEVTITVSVLATHTDRGAYVDTTMANAFPTTGVNGVDYICPTVADKSIATMTKVVTGGEVWYVNTVDTIYICAVNVSYGSISSEVYTGFDTTNVKKTYVGGSALSLDTTGLELTVLDGANVAPEDGTVTATVDDNFLNGVAGTYVVTLNWGNYTVGSYEVLVKNPLVTDFETTAFGNVFTGVEQTNNAAGPMVTVIGWVKSIASTTYGNMYIEDAEGNEIYIYGTYQGGTRYDSLDVDKQPQVGDVVVLTGQATYYNGYQIKNAEIYQLNTEVLYFPPVDAEISEILAGQYDSTLVNVTGVVTSIPGAWNTSYKNMSVYISDGAGNSLYLFRLATQVEVGDVITVTGNVTTYNSAYQLAQGSTAVIHDGGVLVGSASYETLLEAVTAAEDGAQIILTEDVEVETAIIVDKNLTLNLNGKTISCPTDTVGDGVFHVTSGATLTINGEGTVNGTGNNDYNMVIWADGGHVVINGGTYTNEDVVVEDKVDPTHFDLIYVKNGGSVTINGGTFKCVTPKWTLNSNDTYTGTITVNGGSFYQYDPSASETEPNETVSFLGEGYVSTLDGEYYVVGEPAVEGETTLTLSISDIASEEGWTNAQVVSELPTGDENITISVDESGLVYSSNTSKYYTNGNNWRIYNGAILNFEAASGYTISSITITFDSNLSGVTSQNPVTVNASNYAIDVTGTAKITAIEVVYVVSSAQ